MKTIKTRVSSKSDFTSNNSVTSSDTPNKKPRLSVIFMSVLCLLCIAAALFMKISLDKSLSENKELIQKYNELENYKNQLRKDYLSIKSSHDELTSNNDKLSKTVEEQTEMLRQITPEYYFYNSSACIVPVGDTQYHSFECLIDELENYYIFNIETAEVRGYTAHSCMSQIIKR